VGGLLVLFHVGGLLQRPSVCFHAQHARKPSCFIYLDIIYPSSGRTSCSSFRRNKNLDTVVAATEREGKRKRASEREREIAELRGREGQREVF
jgi:hypothetical protein